MRRFRIRKGWFNKAILQELMDSPSYIGGQVDSSIRQYWWQDVDYSKAQYSEYHPDKERDYL